MLAFPTSPTVGQTYTAPNGIVYEWNGILWYNATPGITIPAPVTVSGSPPSSPASGDLWYDNALTFTTFIWAGSGWIACSPNRGIGLGQVYHDLTSTMTPGFVYTYSGSVPKEVIVSAGAGENVSITILVNGNEIERNTSGNYSSSAPSVHATITPTDNYEITVSGSGIYRWIEMY